jgi:hypothetical protein
LKKQLSSTQESATGFGSSVLNILSFYIFLWHNWMDEDSSQPLPDWFTAYIYFVLLRVSHYLLML